jgi:hypothetical protein
MLVTDNGCYVEIKMGEINTNLTIIGKAIELEGYEDR